MTAEKLRDAINKAIDEATVPEEITAIGTDYDKYGFDKKTVKVNFYYRYTDDSVSYCFFFGADNSTRFWHDGSDTLKDISREEALEQIKSRFEKMGAKFDGQYI